MNSQCISCEKDTLQEVFKEKPLCKNCKNNIVTNSFKKVYWHESEITENICCEYCYSHAECISVPKCNYDSSFTYVCKDCSKYCDEVIPLKWKSILIYNQNRNRNIYQTRSDLLTDDFDYRLRAILDSTDEMIVRMTNTYRTLLAKIKAKEIENISKIQSFENSIDLHVRSFSSGPSLQMSFQSYEDAILVFSKNLETLVSKIISNNLLSSGDLEALFQENLNLSIIQTSNFSYLL